MAGYQWQVPKQESLKGFGCKKAHVHGNQVCVSVSPAFSHQHHSSLLSTFVEKELCPPDVF